MIAGPDTKYMMMWCGKWRPVVQMMDGQNAPTTLALRASKVVLWCNELPDNGWVAVAVSSGEIVERFDRDPKLRDWEPLTDPEQAS